MFSFCSSFRALRQPHKSEEGGWYGDESDEGWRHGYGLAVVGDFHPVGSKGRTLLVTDRDSEIFRELENSFVVDPTIARGHVTPAGCKCHAQFIQYPQEATHHPQEVRHPSEPPCNGW